MHTEECLPFFRPALQSRVEELLYSPPAFLVQCYDLLAVRQRTALLAVEGGTVNAFCPVGHSEVGDCCGSGCCDRR